LLNISRREDESSSHMAKFEVILNKICKIAAGLAVASLAIMMFLTATDVTLRYVFNRPITGVYELTEFIMCVLACMAFAYTQLEKGHVTIDIGIVQRLGRRAEAVIDSITHIFGLVIFSLMAWQAIEWAQITKRSGLMSGVLPIEVYPFYYVLLFGLVLLSLVIMVDLAKLLNRAFKK